METIRLKTIRTVNTKRIEHLEINPGRITVVSGANGAGKSSVLDSVQRTLAGGSDPDLIRHGTKSAESYLEIVEKSESGPRTYQVKRVQTPGGSRLEIELNGQPMKKPKSVLESLVHVSSVNPGKFLGGTHAERLALLLESADIRLPDDLKERTGVELTRSQQAQPPLEILQTMEDQVTGERRTIGRTVKSLAAALAELEKREEFPPKEQLALALNRAEQAAEKDAEAAEKAEQAERDRHAAATEEVQGTIDRLKTELAEAEKKKAVADAEHAGQLQTIAATSKETQAEHKQTIAEARQAISKAQEAEAASARIDDIAQSRTEAQAEYDQATERLEAVRSIRKTCMESLPVKDLEVDPNGVLVLQGVTWDHLNTATKIKLVFRLIREAAPDDKLLVICSDALNDLDAGTTAAFFRAAEKMENTYFLLEQVTDGPLAAVAAVEVPDDGE